MKPNAALLLSISGITCGMIARFLPTYYSSQLEKKQSRSRQTGGTGLGLYIVKMILEQHGADYSIRNTEEGVCFSFSL